MERISFKKMFLILGGIALIIFALSGDDCDECFSPQALSFKIILIGFLFIGGSFYYFYKWVVTDSLLYRIERQPIESIDTIAKEVPVSFSGEIQSKEKLLISPYSKTPCVFYHYIKEKFVQSDKSSHWEIVENIAGHNPFSVKDNTGSIDVDLRNVDSDLGTYSLKLKNNNYIDYSNSEIDAEKICFQKSADEVKKNFLGFNTTSKMRVSEYVLRPSQKVYVYGFVHEEKKNKVVAEYKDIPLILSRKSKEKFIEDFAVGDSLFYSHNFILAAGFIALYFSLRYFYHTSAIFLISGLAIISIKMIIQSYNRIITLNNRIGNARSQIDIELKKRFDLIPELEKIVIGIRNHESHVVKHVSEMRVLLVKHKDSIRQKEIYDKILFLSENYGKLNSDKNFRLFMNHLIKVENNLAYYRGFHNKTVMKYNTLIATIPFNLLAKIAGFDKAEYIK